MGIFRLTYDIFICATGLSLLHCSRLLAASIEQTCPACRRTLPLVAQAGPNGNSIPDVPAVDDGLDSAAQPNETARAADIDTTTTTTNNNNTNNNSNKERERASGDSKRAATLAARQRQQCEEKFAAVMRTNGVRRENAYVVVMSVFHSIYLLFRCSIVTSVHCPCTGTGLNYVLLTGGKTLANQCLRSIRFREACYHNHTSLQLILVVENTHEKSTTL